MVPTAVHAEVAVLSSKKGFRCGFDFALKF